MELFYLVIIVKYFGSTVGIEVFWPCKYLSMNDEEVAMTKDQCHVIVDGMNTLSKKRISFKDDSLMENFRVEIICDVENMDNIVEDLHNEELHGEKNYIF
jgi:hypothetical protein